jgi:hypothetical protein
MNRVIEHSIIQDTGDFTTMIQLRYKDKTRYQKEFRYVVPECGHEITFAHTAPVMCPESGCTSKIPRVSMLVSDVNMDIRVKYYVHGEI